MFPGIRVHRAYNNITLIKHLPALRSPIAKSRLSHFSLGFPRIPTILFTKGSLGHANLLTA